MFKIIKESWLDFKKNIGFSVPFFFIIYLFFVAFSFFGSADIVSFSGILSLFITPVLYYALINISIILSRNHNVGWKRSLEGLNRGTYISMIIIAIITNIAVILLSALAVLISLLVPFWGAIISLLVIMAIIIFLIGVLFFPYYYLVDMKTSAIKSIKYSFYLGKKNTYFLIRFALLLFLLNLVGALALGIGLLVTMPISSIATAKVYDLLRLK